MVTPEAHELVPQSHPLDLALWQPERRLMMAVLVDALCDCLANAGALRGMRLSRFRQASDWFRSDDRDWPFSFVNICEACDLDPGLIRRRLVRRIRDQVLGEIGKLDGCGGSSVAGSWTSGGRTYTRPSGSIWTWNSALPSFDQRASSLGGNLTA
jgi:hypothetical protein